MTSLPGEKTSSFAGDLLKLAGGTTFAQALSVLVAPVLSRLYAPDAFGTAAVFASITSIIRVISCLRYELAIMLPERDEDAASLLAVSLGSVAAITASTALLISLARASIVRLLNVPDLAPYIWLVPLAILANGAFLGLNYWSSRKRHFGRLAMAHMLQSAATNGAQLGLAAIAQTHAGGLIASRVLGSTMATTVLAGQVWRDDRRLLMASVQWKSMLAVLKRYRKFPMFDTWAVLLNVISGQLPALLLAGFFSSTIVGYHAIGMRVVYLPMSLLGSAIGQVFFQRAAEANRVGDLADTVRSVFQLLVALVFFPLLVLTVAGEDLFAVVLGGRWSEAGVYAQILGPWMFLVFTSSPMSTLLRVLERQQTALYLNSVIFSSRLLSFVLGGYLGNPRLALALFSASGVLIYGWYTLYILSLAGVSRRYSITILLRYVLYALPGLAMVLSLRLLDMSPMLVTMVAVGLVLVYETVLIFKSPEMLALARRFSQRHSTTGDSHGT